MAKKDSRIERIKEQFSDAAETTKDKLVEAKDTAEGFVKDHPFASLAIAAGIGALIALGVSALFPRAKKKTFLDRLRDRY